MPDCFGELPKYHKSDKKYDWKYKGLITDDFDSIYNRYITSKNCEKCGAEYKRRRDRCMDHCHSTGAFRNILCRACNNSTDVQMRSDNTSGFTHIKTNINKRLNIEYWVIEITSKGKNYYKNLNKKNNTIEEVVAFRNAMYDDLGLS